MLYKNSRAKFSISNNSTIQQKAQRYLFGKAYYN